MARHPENELGFSFTNVQIFRDQELGHGSYGAVYKAKCDSLPCAAKLIYPVLFASNLPAQQPASPPDKEHRQPLRRFEAECRFLSHIKHPNIVQFLGVYHDPQSNIPVLLMELMDESFTHFLETPQNTVFYHLQVNILHDTALALAFLHSNGITHRDMSSNNVLLIAGNRAKVTDFGMSMLTDAAASQLESLTQCPGTPAYMSPEALDKPPVYSEKLDCFSFGVLTIQAITRQFPKPTDRFQIIEVPHPTQPSLKVPARFTVSEEERRQSHISLIPAAHPLQSIALSCITDKDTERPTAEQLCQSLEQLKLTQLYASSVQQIHDRECQTRKQGQNIEEKDEQIQDKNGQFQDKDRQIQENLQQIQDKDRQIQENLQQIQDKDRQIQQNFQQIQDKDQQLRSMQREIQQVQKLLDLKNFQITELQQGRAQHGEIPPTHPQDTQPQLQHPAISEHKEAKKKPALKRFTLKKRKKVPKASHGPNEQTDDLVKKIPASQELTLTWRKGPNAPDKVRRGSSITGDTVYINDDCRNVYSFNYSTSIWSILPECPYSWSTLTTINNMLTAVGGALTNKLLTYRDHKWVELYPSMPTVRRYATVLSTTTHVAVMGGFVFGSSYLDCVEVMDIAANQWSTAAQLPFGICTASTILCGDTVYLMGGNTADSNKDYSVLSCHFNELIHSSRCSTQAQPTSTILTPSKIWHHLPDLPVSGSTCVTVHGKVLAIGGKDKQHKDTTSIYKLNMDTNKWCHKGDMNIGRSHCLATTLSDNNILVVGGVTGGDKTDETEIFTTS